MDDLYKKHTQGIDKPVLCKDMFVVSNTMSEECEEYRHCEYQSTIAAIVASQNSNF